MIWGILMKKLGEILDNRTNTIIHVCHDAYNFIKVWCIKVSGGHYYYKQMINAIVTGSYLNGRLVALNDSHNVCNSKWTRATKRNLIDIGIFGGL